jgi:hypothetical protein
MPAKRSLALAHRSAEIQRTGNGAAQPLGPLEAGIASFVVETR